MKQLDLAELKPDPLIKAQADAGRKTIRISGYVRSVGDDTISIASTQTARSHVECPRAAVVAAFSGDHGSKKVTFLVANDARVRVVTEAQADELAASGSCGCSGTGVLEARPLDSISPWLARWAALRAELLARANSPLSPELTCGQARSDCFRLGGTRAECDEIYRDCLSPAPLPDNGGAGIPW